MIHARSLLRFSTVAALVVAVAGCEPLDTGGGGGAGDDGNFAFIEDGRLVSVGADATGRAFYTDNGTFAGDPAMSPNGQSIAFAYSAANDETATSIYVVARNAAGSTAQLIAEPASGESFRSPAWDRSSSTIYFVSSGKVYRVASAGGSEPEQVASSISNAKYVSVIDASSLLVMTTTGALSKVAIADGASTAITSSASKDSRPAVSADGKQVAYANAAGAIVVRDLTAGSETPMPSGSSVDAHPTFSPDGTFIAFESGGAILRTETSGTKNREMLFSKGSMPSWGL